MKRIIATALSILVGAFGYTIVDSAIEDRIATLESEVVELREIISDYHNNITETILSTISNTTKPSPTTIGATTTTYPEQIAGYRYDYNGNFYYSDDKECWQENASYNEIYDNYAPMTAMFIDQVRIRFDYAGQEWMIQLWKGQYGWQFVGAEIGVYTAPIGTYKDGAGSINHYKCADKEDWLNIQLDCYWAEGNNGHYKKAFTREYSKYWWATGFVKGQLTKYTAPRTELKVRGRITFKSETMANLFVQGLHEGGFKAASGYASNQLGDDCFYQDGADVWLLWTNIFYDASVGYTSTTYTTTTRPSTTTPITTQIYY